ncbi:MAG: 30S ribosomal protein S6 [Pyrinomonadaceae bacterium]
MAEKRVYELMYIVNPEMAADEVTKLNETLQGVIESQGGAVVKLDDMGKRKMAYEINRKTEGHYVLFEIEGSGKEIAELERRMRVNDAVMRYITVRVDEERKTGAKHTARREQRRSKRRSQFNNKQTLEDKMLAEEREDGAEEKE